jgi:hypothetical protein
MKVRLETEPIPIKSRGVELTSETLEEREYLEKLWCSNGRIVECGSTKSGDFVLIIAPKGE